MAQDFGDEVGDMLFRSMGRFVTRVAGDYLTERIKQSVREFHEQRLEANGMSKDEARAAAEVMASREHVCIPFGTAPDASYFAKVCQENDIYAGAFTDEDGNGYIQFAKDDLEKMQDCTAQFSEVMASLKNREICDILDKAEPVPQETFDSLKQADLPDIEKNLYEHDVTLPGRTNRAVDEQANDPYSHTLGIRDKVLAARGQCRDLDDFKALLAKEGIGITEAVDSDIKLYEARLGGKGEILPYDKDLDWSVTAKTLATEKYQCDVTLDWFEKNTPKEPTVPAYETVPPQKDLNLICNAVRGDLEERGIRTLDRPDGKMGFLVDAKHKQEVIEAVEARFPGHTPDELGIGFDDGGRGNPPAPQVADGSLDTDGRTPDFNQGIESHDGMDTATNTARMEREQSNTDVAPSVVRESSQPRLKEVEKEMRAASKQLSQTNDSPDRDISDKFQQER